MPRLRTMAVFAVLLLLLAPVAEAGKKKKKRKKKGDDDVPAVIVGWHQAEGMVGACYHPPQWEELGRTEHLMARTEALEAIMSQWKGERDDGVTLDPRAVTNVETVLLGLPDKIEGVVDDNLAQCQKAMKGGGTDAWNAWLVALPGKLNKGECRRPLDDTMVWYLDIGMGWQGPASVCEGEPIEITATERDLYKVDDGGDWINAEGNTSKPATGEGYLCTLENCHPGALLLRFRGESGAELIQPIGTRLVFTPPEHGQIEFTINDTSYFNNEWKVVKGIQHRTSVTYEPASE